MQLVEHTTPRKKKNKCTVTKQAHCWLSSSTAEEDVQGPQTKSCQARKQHSTVFLDHINREVHYIQCFSWSSMVDYTYYASNQIDFRKEK